MSHRLFRLRAGHAPDINFPHMLSSSPGAKLEPELSTWAVRVQLCLGLLREDLGEPACSSLIPGA